MLGKGLIEASDEDMTRFKSEGKLHLDAKSASLKKACESQKAILMKMDDSSLTAFAASINLIKKEATKEDTSFASVIASLKVESSSTENWLDGLKWS